LSNAIKIVGTLPVTNSGRMNKRNINLSDIILLISRLSRFCQIFATHQYKDFEIFPLYAIEKEPMVK